MRAVSLLTRVFAVEFYRLNAGFFLIVLGLAFGFLRDVEHLALAQFFIRSPLTLLIPVAAWALYAVKVILFNRQAVRKPENEFCYHAGLLPPGTQRMATGAVAVLQLAPGLLYGTFLLAICLANARYGTMLSIVLAHGVLFILTALALSADLKKPKKESGPSFIKRWLDRKWNKPYPLMVVEWIARNEPLTLLGTKIMTYAVLWSVAYLYTTYAYDLRLMALGTTFAFGAHVVLLYHCHRFENFHFSLYRNLPFTWPTRSLHFFIVLSILCVPEAGLLLTAFPRAFSAAGALLCLAYGISLLVFLYGMLYTKARPLENIIQQTFFLTLALFVLILFNIPLLLLSTVNLAAGFFLRRNYYDRFDY